MRILAINPGSSSLKATLLDGETVLSDHEMALDETAQKIGEALSKLSLWSRDLPPEAIGVRVVHGGRLFRESVRVDLRTIGDLSGLAELAPLHIPIAVRVLSALLAMDHALPIVAVFDTMFHRSLPEAARRYAVPDRWFSAGVEKYGFHGLSYDDIVHRLPGLSGARLPERLVAVHWGNGASVCAIRNGLSVETSMGLTPLDGLVMGTRSGAIDPGILPFLLRKGESPKLLEEELTWKSGLFALSGGVSDFKEVGELRGKGDARATLAFEKSVNAVAQTIGAYAAVLEGIDALVFTGGVGEHSWEARSAVMRKIGFLGVREDPLSNRFATGDRKISGSDSPVIVWALHAREDRTVARETEKVVCAKKGGESPERTRDDA
ncbi:MAG: acetate/propionate family kinase [Leptospirillia bacterium]